MAFIEGAIMIRKTVSHYKILKKLGGRLWRFKSFIKSN